MTWAFPENWKRARSARHRIRSSICIVVAYLNGSVLSLNQRLYNTRQDLRTKKLRHTHFSWNVYMKITKNLGAELCIQTTSNKISTPGFSYSLCKFELSQFLTFWVNSRWKMAKVVLTPSTYVALRDITDTYSNYSIHIFQQTYRINVLAHINTRAHATIPLLYTCTAPEIRTCADLYHMRVESSIR